MGVWRQGIVCGTRRDRLQSKVFILVSASGLPKSSLIRGTKVTHFGAVVVCSGPKSSQLVLTTWVQDCWVDAAHPVL